jgi:hypothetical protein
MNNSGDFLCHLYLLNRREQRKKERERKKERRRDKEREKKRWKEEEQNIQSKR